MYDKLYEAAKLDLESVKILNDNDLFAPAIYHCAQAIVKVLKGNPRLLYDKTTTCVST